MRNFFFNIYLFFKYFFFKNDKNVFFKELIENSQFKILNKSNEIFNFHYYRIAKTKIRKIKKKKTERRVRKTPFLLYFFSNLHLQDRFNLNPLFVLVIYSVTNRFSYILFKYYHYFLFILKVFIFSLLLFIFCYYLQLFLEFQIDDKKLISFNFVKNADFLLKLNFDLNKNMFVRGAFKTNTVFNMISDNVFFSKIYNEVRSPSLNQILNKREYNELPILQYSQKQAKASFFGINDVSLYDVFDLKNKKVDKKYKERVISFYSKGGYYQKYDNYLRGALFRKMTYFQKVAVQFSIIKYKPVKLTKKFYKSSHSFFLNDLKHFRIKYKNRSPRTFNDLYIVNKNLDLFKENYSSVFYKKDLLQNTLFIDSLLSKKTQEILNLFEFFIRKFELWFVFFIKNNFFQNLINIFDYWIEKKFKSKKNYENIVYLYFYTNILSYKSSNFFIFKFNRKVNCDILYMSIDKEHFFIKFIDYLLKYKQNNKIYDLYFDSNNLIYIYDFLETKTTHSVINRLKYINSTKVFNENNFIEVLYNTSLETRFKNIFKELLKKKLYRTGGDFWFTYLKRAPFLDQYVRLKKPSCSKFARRRLYHFQRGDFVRFFEKTSEWLRIMYNDRIKIEQKPDPETGEFPEVDEKIVYDDVMKRYNYRMQKLKLNITNEGIRKNYKGQMHHWLNTYCSIQSPKYGYYNTVYKDFDLFKNVINSTFNLHVPVNVTKSKYSIYYKFLKKKIQILKFLIFESKVFKNIYGDSLKMKIKNNFRVIYRIFNENWKLIILEDINFKFFSFSYVFKPIKLFFDNSLNFLDAGYAYKYKSRRYKRFFFTALDRNLKQRILDSHYDFNPVFKRFYFVYKQLTVNKIQFELKLKLKSFEFFYENVIRKEKRTLFLYRRYARGENYGLVNSDSTFFEKYFYSRGDNDFYMTRKESRLFTKWHDILKKLKTKEELKEKYFHMQGGETGIGYDNKNYVNNIFYCDNILQNEKGILLKLKLVEDEFYEDLKRRLNITHVTRKLKKKGLFEKYIENCSFVESFILSMFGFSIFDSFFINLNNRTVEFNLKEINKIPIWSFNLIRHPITLNRNFETNSIYNYKYPKIKFFSNLKVFFNLFLTEHYIDSFSYLQTRRIRTHDIMFKFLYPRIFERFTDWNTINSHFFRNNYREQDYGRYIYYLTSWLDSSYLNIVTFNKNTSLRIPETRSIYYKKGFISSYLFLFKNDDFSNIIKDPEYSYISFWRALPYHIDPLKCAYNYRSFNYITRPIGVEIVKYFGPDRIKDQTFILNKKLLCR
jgi:hypothetical protein